VILSKNQNHTEPQQFNPRSPAFSRRAVKYPGWESKGEPNMKTLLLAAAFFVVISGPALACRGTTEFPEVSTQLQQSTVSPERLSELMQRLSQGQAMHEEGHSQGDGSEMGVQCLVFSTKSRGKSANNSLVGYHCPDRPFWGHRRKSLSRSAKTVADH